MKIFTKLSIFYLFSTFYGTVSYKHFQSSIPNGNRVVDPCVPSQIWDGVGHTSVFGGRALNPFGTDFVNAGKVRSVQSLKNVFKYRMILESLPFPKVDSTASMANFQWHTLLLPWKRQHWLTFEKKLSIT